MLRKIFCTLAAIVAFAGCTSTSTARPQRFGATQQTHYACYNSSGVIEASRQGLNRSKLQCANPSDVVRSWPVSNPGTTPTTIPSPVTTTTSTTFGLRRCFGVAVSPGDNIQAKLDANPTGTTFCFAPGTYVLTSYITPKDNDILISSTPRGAVLTGQDTYNAGVYGNPGPDPSGTTGVVVQGFVITHFLNSWTGFPRSGIAPGYNWTVRDNEISYNSESGIHVTDNDVVVKNWIHHNGRYGFDGGPTYNVLMDQNEISFNNTRQLDPGNDAGGSKLIGIPGNGSFVGGVTDSNVVISNNRVHDNYGNGLWCDVDCDHVSYLNNTVTNNSGMGIFTEISWNTTITGNTVSGNGSLWTNQLCFYGQILSGYSVNTEIASNTVTAAPGTNGICAADGDRGTDPAYPTLQTGLYVHDNTVYMVAGSLSGMVGREATYSGGSNNRFVNNHYHVPDTGATYFDWKSGLNATAPQTWTAWNGLGQDTGGSFGT